MTEGAAPRWVRDAAVSTWRELQLYAAATWGMVRRPGRFAIEWSRGEARAPNPLAMMATGAALSGVRQLVSVVLGFDYADTFWAGVLSALGPYAHYVLIGGLCHLVLRWLGKRPVALGDTVAMALFSGAGPAAVAEALLWLVTLALSPWFDPTVMLTIAFGVAFSVFCVVLASNLGALHDATWWKLLVTYSIVFPLSGLLFGLLQPAGYYGLHWVIGVRGGPPISLGM